MASKPGVASNVAIGSSSLEKVRRAMRASARSIWMSHDGDLPPEIYHYTDATGLAGILHSKRIWASDVLFLNDRSELMYAEGIIKSVLRSMSGTVPRKLLDMLSNKVRFLGEDRDFHLYATCFCTERNLLSQWRGYGRSGGFALQVDPFVLIKAAKKVARGPGSVAGFVKIEYVAEAQRRIARSLIDSFANDMGNVRKQHEDRILSECISYLGAAMVRFKHPAFRQENEWRLVIRREARTAEFGTRDGLLVPYLAIPFPKIALLRLMVGPSTHVSLVRRSLVHALPSIGWPGLEVDASRTPLR